MTPDIDIVVGTSDLRAALSSVLVHADPRPKNFERHQVRLDVTPDNVLVTATDSSSAALAKISVHANNSGVLGGFVLVPEEAKKILSIFTAGAESADEPQYIVQLHLDDEDHLTIVDQSGLIAGRSLRVPIIPAGEATTERSIDVTKLISGLVHSTRRPMTGVVFPGRTTARFNVAGKAYHGPLDIDSVAGSRSWLVRCQGKFLGALMPFSRGENEESERERHEMEWRDLLPVPEVDQ